MDLVNENGNPRLLGFLLPDDFRSAEPTLVPVNGLTVLYGLNGAGKTRSLQAIRDFFSGSRGAQPMALIQLGAAGCDAHRTWAPDWSRAAERPPVDYWSAEEAEDALSAWVEHNIDYDEDQDVIHAPADAGRWQGLIDEWHAQRLLLVTPIGTAHAPRWLSWPAVLTGPSTSYSNREVEFLERVASADDFDTWHVVAFVIDGRLPGGQVILGAAPRGMTALDMPWSYGAQHEDLLDLGLRWAEEFEDVDKASRRFMVRVVEGDQIAVHDGTVAPSDRLEELRQRLLQRAGAFYAGILQDAPRLRLDVSVVGLDAGVRWTVESDARYESKGRDLAQLSSAQERWARWAIARALTEMAAEYRTARLRADAAEEIPEQLLQTPASLTIIDEPEAALHRSAEGHMAKFIRASASPWQRFVVATHSPELLDARNADVVEVSRRDGRACFAPLGGVDFEAMHSLGLTPSDLLRRQRGFLLVEGQHDKDVLQILLGDELRRLRVDVLPLRGATTLSAPRTRFLFRYTPAHVFVMLDNLNTDHVRRAWERIRAAFLAEGLDAARAALGEEFPRGRFGKDTEVIALSEFLSASLDHGDWGRVTPFGLTRGDIIEYLPVREFVPGKLTWEQLREAFDKERADGTTKANNFKKWLPSRGGNITDEAVRRAAESMDHIPKDFELLRKTIEAVTDQA